MMKWISLIVTISVSFLFGVQCFANEVQGQDLQLESAHNKDNENNAPSSKTKGEEADAENTLNVSQETSPAKEEPQPPGQKKENKNSEQSDLKGEGKAEDKNPQPINNADHKETASNEAFRLKQGPDKDPAVTTQEGMPLKSDEAREQISEEVHDLVRPKPVEVPSLQPIAKPVKVVPMSPTILPLPKKPPFGRTRVRKKDLKKDKIPPQFQTTR